MQALISQPCSGRSFGMKMYPLLEPEVVGRGAGLATLPVNRINQKGKNIDSIWYHGRYKASNMGICCSSQATVHTMASPFDAASSYSSLPIPKLSPRRMGIHETGDRAMARICFATEAINVTKIILEMFWSWIIQSINYNLVSLDAEPIMQQTQSYSRQVMLQNYTRRPWFDSKKLESMWGLHRQLGG